MEVLHIIPPMRNTLQEKHPRDCEDSSCPNVADECTHKMDKAYQAISFVSSEYDKIENERKRSITVNPKHLSYDHFPSVQEMENFGYVHYINTEEELDNWLKREKSEDATLYRGHADASWLMKSTLLRLSEELGCDFACMEDRHFQHVKEWIVQEGLGEAPNEDQILFYAQHYGKKSSLLDFTLSPHIALFFASERDEPIYHDSELADYISVIKLDNNKESNFFNWREGKESCNTESVVDLLKNINHPVWIKEDWPQNERMNAQKGAFVYLSKHSAHSVEAVFRETVENGQWKPIISYFLVSRNLLPYIRDMLSRLGINRKSLCLEEDRAPKDISDVVLYRYMPWDAFEKTLDSWKLKATIASQTNDFFEFLPAASKDSEIDDYAKALTRENTAFFCFSKLMSSCAMWGHYAEQYKGVCMVFYFPKTLKPCRRLCEVAYQKDRIPVGEVSDSEDASRIIDLLLTTKDISWQFEHEARLLYEAKDADEALDGKLFFREPMKYFVGVILGTRCPYSAGYVKALIKQSIKKNKIRNGNLYKNIDDLVTKSSVHPTEFRITDEFWEDDMTRKKLRNKGYIFYSNTQIRKNTAMKERTKSIVAKTYPNEKKSFSQEIFCALQTATLLEKHLNAKGTPYKVSDDDILPMQVLVRDMALEKVIKRMLHHKTYKCLDYNDKTIVLAFDVYTHKDLDPDKLIEEGIHIICRIIDPLKHKIN